MASRRAPTRITITLDRFTALEFVKMIEFFQRNMDQIAPDPRITPEHMRLLIPIHNQIDKMLAVSIADSEAQNLPTKGEDAAHSNTAKPAKYHGLNQEQLRTVGDELDNIGRSGSD